jgi:signal transduction histidine kinase
VCATAAASGKRGSVAALEKASNMQQQDIAEAEKSQAAKPAKPRARKEISSMRKLTSEIDAEMRKVEANKLKLEKLQKTIATGNERIKMLASQLAKNFS